MRVVIITRSVVGQSESRIHKGNGRQIAGTRVTQELRVESPNRDVLGPNVLHRLHAPPRLGQHTERRHCPAGDVQADDRWRPDGDKSDKSPHSKRAGLSAAEQSGA